MTTGTYEEPLPCGGKLKVSKTSWEVAYYFSGPDMRYNGTFVNVPGSAIQQYISAFRDNFAEYRHLKGALPKGGEFSKVGQQGMTIRVGHFSEEVCIRSYHMPINSESHLEKVISGYLYAASRAPQIQQFLANL